MKTIQLPTPITTDLEHIHGIIAERLRFRSEVERIAAPHALRPGAERIHAALVLLCARLGDYSLEACMHAAAAAELIYAASSLHTTLVGELAQSTPSWKGNVSLMVGDYLYALAAAEMALTPDQRIIAAFSESVMAICEGQMATVQPAVSLSKALEQYQYRVGRETAALCEAACKVGAICGKVDAGFLDALAKYGYELGMALAIVRDVQKLRNGILTAPISISLPLIYAADESYPLSKLLSSDAHTEEQLTTIINDTLQLGGDTRAMGDARQHVEQACSALEQIPASEYRHDLERLARGVGSAEAS